MKFKPSDMESYLNTLPEDLQKSALEVIKEEHNRWERSDLTEKEKKFLYISRCCGKSMARVREDIAIKIFNKEV